MKSSFVLIFLSLLAIGGCASKNKKVEKMSVSELQAQEEPEQVYDNILWVINLMNSSCIQYPGGSIDEMVSGLQEETGEVCQVSLEDIPGEPVRTIVCGDMQTGKAWIVTETEETCQAFIKAYENYYQQSGEQKPVGFKI